MTRFSRREFLEESLLAATAALAVSERGLIPGAAHAGASPNERIRVAVLGVNGQGRSHLKGYTRPDAEVVMICDPDEAVGRAGVERIKAATGKEPKWVADPRQVMDDRSVDAVSIATPNHWHSLAAIWAIQSGKDVYVEKPVSHNVSEGRRVVEAARKYQRICQTGTQIRSSTGIQQAIEFVRAGKLGPIEVARGLCYKRRGSIGTASGPQEPPSTVNYDVWLGPAPKEPVRRQKFHYDWHWQWEYGNGDVGNQGIHQMDLARWALGVNQVADAVVSVGGRLGYEDDGQTPNTLCTFYRYGDRQLIFETRGLPTDNYRDAAIGDVIHCKEGYLVISSYANAAAFDKDGNLVQKFSGGGDHFANFLQAVRSRKPSDLAADIEEGHLSSALCHLGNISYRLGSQQPFSEARRTLEGNDAALETLERTRTHLAKAGVDLDKTKVVVGKPLALDPAAETFRSDAQANSRLTRDYRSPYVVPAAGQV